MKKSALIVEIICLILLCIGLGTGAYFTNGFSFTSIENNQNVAIITINGVELTTNTILAKTSALRIDCSEAFTAKVIPSDKVAFDFRVNDVLYGFQFQDYTSAFIKTYEGYFTINTAFREMKEVLKMQFPDKVISDIPLDKNSDCFFVLVIETQSKTISIKLKDIALVYRPVESVELDKPEIIL